MSDADVLDSILQMEELLNSESRLMPEEIERWQRRFQASLESAEHGLHWPEIVNRAKDVNRMLESTVSLLMAERDAIRKEMESHITGQRALKGYRPADLR